LGTILALFAGLCLPAIFRYAVLTLRNRPSSRYAEYCFSVSMAFTALTWRLCAVASEFELGKLSSSGVTYTEAFYLQTFKFFPGLLSLVTGGSPLSTAFGTRARTRDPFRPRARTARRSVQQVIWSNALDKNKKLLDAGGGIDPAKLPLDPSKGCIQVYPTVFSVLTLFRGCPFRWDAQRLDLISIPRTKWSAALLVQVSMICLRPEIGSAARM